jgi:hypothetical protein
VRGCRCDAEATIGTTKEGWTYGARAMAVVACAGFAGCSGLSRSSQNDAMASHKNRLSLQSTFFVRASQHVCKIPLRYLLFPPKVPHTWSSYHVHLFFNIISHEDGYFVLHISEYTSHLRIASMMNGFYVDWSRSGKLCVVCPRIHSKRSSRSHPQRCT